MELNIQLLSIFEMAVFLTAVVMHVVRRNSTLITIYALQSLAVNAALVAMAVDKGATGLLLVAIASFSVKVLAAPVFFSKLLHKKELSMSSTTYLSLPITLGIILGLTILVRSTIFTPLISIFPGAIQLVTFSLAQMLISMFLIINRRGVFSQLIGILSFENGLVAFSILAGVEQTLVIELGILFDILLWIVISTVLVTLIYNHFGSLDTREMNSLKD